MPRTLHVPKRGGAGVQALHPGDRCHDTPRDWHHASASARRRGSGSGRQRCGNGWRRGGRSCWPGLSMQRTTPGGSNFCWVKKEKSGRLSAIQGARESRRHCLQLREGRKIAVSHAPQSRARHRCSRVGAVRVNMKKRRGGGGQPASAPSGPTCGRRIRYLTAASPDETWPQEKTSPLSACNVGTARMQE